MLPPYAKFTIQKLRVCWCLVVVTQELSVAALVAVMPSGGTVSGTKKMNALKTQGIRVSLLGTTDEC